MKSEFEFINDLKSRYSLRYAGDDCAVLPKDDRTDLLITADLLAEGVDFQLQWTTAEQLGHKTLAVSLSDVAAMGGSPIWALTSIAVPEALWKSGFLDEFYAGWHGLAREHDVQLVGGDVSRSTDRLVIDSVVGGIVDKGKALFRTGASAGDAIFVTGFLGGAAAGLRLLKDRELTADLSVTEQHILRRQLEPIPHVRTGKLLYEYGLTTAMIDISDGLSSDLAHLCHASGLGARIYADRIPVDPAIADALPGEDGLDLALHGGEDFELLVTVPIGKVAVALDLGFHRIGEMTDRSGVIELVDEGTVSTLVPRGWSHF